LTMDILRLVKTQLKSHPGLIPLFVFLGTGGIMCGAYVTRLALKSPEACYDRRGNPEPWNNIEPTNQYKLFRVNMDYTQQKRNGPEY